MKDNKIDELFKAGLSQNKLTPPPAAWSKIEAELPAKSKKGAYFFLSIAASLVIILSLGWMLLSKVKSSEIVQPQEQAKIEQDIQKTPSTPQDNQPVQEEIEQEEDAQPIDIITNVPQQLVAELAEQPVKELDTKATQEIEVQNETILTLEKLVPKGLDRSSIALVQGFKFMPMDIDLQHSLQAYVNNLPAYQEDLDKKKRFSVLGSIVSVAREVNSGKLGLSELRKSKNDFVQKELKYGDKTAGSDDDEDSPLNQ